MQGYLIKLLVAASAAFIVVGCKLDKFKIFGRSANDDNGAQDQSPAPETQSPDVAVISANSSESQKLAGSGEITGTFVSFPPGSLAVDTQVSLVAGGRIDEDLLSELGFGEPVAAAGTSVIVDSDGDSDPVGTISVTLPLPSESGSALTAGTLYRVVIYRVVVKATGNYLIGIIPESGFTGSDPENKTVTVEAKYFGQFQTLLLSTEVGQKLEKQSATSGFKNAAGEYKPSTTKTVVTTSDSSTNTNDQTPPAVPGDFQLSGPSGTLPSRNVTLTWTSASGAKNMTLKLGQNASCSSATHSITVPAGESQATFTGVPNGTYYYCAVASNDAGTKPASGASFVVGPVVVGKANFTANSCAVSSACVSKVLRAIYTHGRLIATDDRNHRVLIWNKLPSANGQSADLVLGQADFSSYGINRGGGGDAAAGNTMRSPLGVSFDGTRLVVADSDNNRVLIWNTFPTVNGQSADIVLGQPDLTSLEGLNEYSLVLPYSALLHDGKLIVTDTNNNRVQIWNAVPTTSGVTPDLIIGQPDRYSTSVGTSDSLFDTPFDTAVINNDLWVLEANSNNRLVRFNPFPTSSFGAANLVVGQPDMTTTGSGTSASTFNQPHGVTSYGTKLFVADYDNNRILVWNTIPTTNGAPAQAVIGQPDLNSATVQVTSETSLKQPTGVHINDGTMVIADWGNERILLRPYP